MKSIVVSAAALLVMAGSTASQAAGQPSPSSMDRQHHDIAQQLSRYTAGDIGTAAAAERVLELLKSHQQKESGLVLPLLSLLPELCEGRIAGDMAFAIEMADALKAERQAMFDENAEIMAAVGELIQAGGPANETDLVVFGGLVADHVMSEIELSEPAAILVGDAVRLRLASNR